MELIRAEHALLGLGTGDGMEGDSVELHGRGVPVMRVALDGDDFVDLPLVESEGAVANEVLRARPLAAAFVGLAVLGDGRQVDGHPRRVIDEREEIRRRPDERDLERVVIDDLVADLRKVLQLALVVSLRVLHDVMHVGVLRRERGLEDPFEGLVEVARRDGIAVGPLGVLAEEKCVSQQVRRNFPALRRARHGVQILRILIREALEEAHEDHVLRHTGDNLRVEVRRLGAVAAMENHLARRNGGAGAEARVGLCAVAARCAGLVGRLLATHEQGGQANGGEQCFHGDEPFDFGVGMEAQSAGGRPGSAG